MISGANGLIASQHYLASDIGADVLRSGGNAADAVVAAGLAIGIAEPWMSGIGGGGFMQFYDAIAGTVRGIDFAMCAPQGIDPSDYALSGDEGGADSFNWPSVVEDRNVKGPHSIAVPGYIAGASLALETFGTRSWPETIAPAVELAEFGLPLDWFATQKITNSARDLRNYAESARVYLPDGLPPVADLTGMVHGLPFGNLAETYRRLRDAGPEDYYQGEIASRIVADAGEAGSKISAADLRTYEAQLFDGEAHAYREATVYAPPGLNAGPSLCRALDLLAGKSLAGGAPDEAAYRAYAEALLQAYDERFATMGIADRQEQSNTTHIGVIDRHGNIASWTQTIMSAFGSKVMFPRTGITMNNGMMWFDPVPGRPNSITPGIRPLSNMCPSIVETADGFRFSVGACGGRKIFPAVFQLISFLVDYKMDLDTALHHPRLDVCGTDLVTMDSRIDKEVIEAMAKDYNVSSLPNAVFPNGFALPNIVGQEPGSGKFIGGAFIMSPTAKVSRG